MITAKLDYEGNANILYILEPPKLFGLEIAATPSQISSTTVTCAEDKLSVRLKSDTEVSWPAQQLISIAAFHLSTEGKLASEFRNKIMYNMLTLLANENMRKMYKIELLCHKSLRERVLTYLRFVAQRTKNSTSFTIPFTREQLAQYLNVNRSALSHELALMQQ